MRITHWNCALTDLLGPIVLGGLYIITAITDAVQICNNFQALSEGPEVLTGRDKMKATETKTKKPIRRVCINLLASATATAYVYVYSSCPH